MYLPNYKDGSIVNLMSSIEKALGGKPRYKPLKILKPLELSKSRNIVLLIIDGLGYEYLRKKGRNTVFNEYLRGKITSVFPTDTAAAIPTFFTGLAPQQHAISGWFMYLKELGIVSAILPFIQRGGKLSLSQLIKPKKIFSQKSFFEKIRARSYVVQPEKIIRSDYTLANTKGVEKVPYVSMSDYFKQINRIIKSSNHKKFIYAYWPEFDDLAHREGIKSKKTFAHFRELNKNLNLFLSSVRNSTIIITGDHGIIDTTKSKIIELKKHPKLAETLIFPLCGGPRSAYCYVRLLKIKQFETYVKNHLKNCCYLYKSRELIKKNYFGLFEPSRKLFDRVGDYTLIMKENFIIKDFVIGEKEHFSIGHHGGVSKEEMIVPLIVISKF